MTFVSTTTPITGRLGDFLLLRVEPQMGSDQGRSCLFIDSDVFSLSSVYIGEGSGLPGPGGCGDAPDPMVFSPGTYTLIAGVHANAAFFDTALIPSPEREIRMTVNVDGVTQVQISGEALSRLLLGDVNCDGVVDAADALDILRDEGGLPVVAGEGCPVIGE
jgi:hypothetical protein